MSQHTLYFVQISDTHIGPSPDYRRHGHNPYSCALKLVEVINGLPFRPDFVIHTGDVVYDSDPAAYQRAAEIFNRLDAPVYYVNGNHDDATLIRKYLEMGPNKQAGDDPDRLSYSFEFKGYRFLILDARGPDEIDPQGQLAESQLDLVAREAGFDAPPLVIFVHFPALALNSPWMDKNMLITNGQTLHHLLSRIGKRLRGVFHGHVHQPMQTIRDGVFYVSGASAFSQFGAWPNDIDTSYDVDHDPGYNFVQFLPGQTIIHQHTFPRPVAVPSR